MRVIESDKEFSKVYIAAPFTRREEARQLRDALVNLGLTVTSSWLDTTTENYDAPLEVLQNEAWYDKEDIEAADYVVVLVYPGEGCGMHFEAGYAHHAGIHLVVIGDRSKGIFYLLDDHTYYPSITAYLESFE